MEKLIARKLVEEARRIFPRIPENARVWFWHGFWSAARALISAVGAKPQEVEDYFDQHFDPKEGANASN